jgi:hypothetical protein
MFRRGLIVIGALVGLFGSAQAAAQQRPMGQGEARVSARSDVRMGVESGPGTSGNKLQDMVAAITSKLGDIRQCYGSVTEERPTVEGEMSIRVLLARGRGRPELRFEENTVEDRQLTRCVRRHLRRANYGGVARPANVKVNLTFSNTAARGIHETRERSAEEADVNVRRGSDGRLYSVGGTDEVRYKVLSDAEARVAAVHRGLRTAIAGLLDCRRRAGRRNMDPAGTIRVLLAVPRQGAARVRLIESTLEDERAPNCVQRALRQHRFAPEARGHSDVELTFAGRAHIQEARPE